MTKWSPKSREYLSWALVGLWSGLIFVSIPYVRRWVDYVREEWRAELFTYVTAACVVLVLAAAVALLAKRRRKTVAGYAWLLGIAGLVIYLIFDLKDGSPVEAVHFLQYGMLSLLLFRAFAHRVRDYGIYAAATVVGGTVGMIDETIQWLTPGRVFALEDIWLNFTAVALFQLALAAGIRPRAISGWPDGAGLRRLCSLAALAAAYLGLCFLNTPDRIAWLSARVHLPDFIAHNHGVMVEYGYLHGDADTGIFRSRLPVEALRRLARERAAEGARALAQYLDLERYGEFLEAYTPMNDAFLHEAGVHLYSRNAYLEWARNATDDEQRRLQYTYAYWENRILEDNFAELLGAANARWPAALEAEVKGQIDPDWVFDSWVSRHLITAITRQQAFWLFSCLVVGLLLLGRLVGRRRPR